MTKKEVLKYVNFSTSGTVCDSDGIECPGSVLARKEFGAPFTFMIGHQPRSLTPEEIEARKITHPNHHTTIDADDPYWTDDVGVPFGFEYDTPSHTYTDEELGGRCGVGVYKYPANIAGKIFEVIVVNDCGFAVAYGPLEIYEYINASEEEKTYNYFDKHNETHCSKKAVEVLGGPVVILHPDTNWGEYFGHEEKPIPYTAILSAKIWDKVIGKTHPHTEFVIEKVDIDAYVHGDAFATKYGKVFYMDESYPWAYMLVSDANKLLELMQEELIAKNKVESWDVFDMQNPDAPIKLATFYCEIAKNSFLDLFNDAWKKEYFDKNQQECLIDRYIVGNFY